MAGNSSVLLTYVFPTVGCLISLLTFSSSFVAVLQVRRTKRLGELNPIPYTGILGLTSGQVIYGSLIKNWFVFFANAPGLLIGLWLTLSTIPHATPKVQNIMTAVIMVLAMYYSVIALVTTHLDVSNETRNTIWGFAAAVSLVFFYVGPLSTLVKVVKNKDSSSLNPPFSIMVFMNVVMWLSYGLAIKNPFIWVPETIGGALATTGLVLMMIFPRREVVRERERFRQESLARDANNLETQAADHTSQAADGSSQAPSADIQMATGMHRAYLSRP